MKSPKIHRVLVYTDREYLYSRVMDSRIHVTDAKFGLKHASKTKEMWTKNTTWYCVLFYIILLENVAS